jgi:hypothetical protein
MKLPGFKQYRNYKIDKTSKLEPWFGVLLFSTHQQRFYRAGAVLGYDTAEGALRISCAIFMRIISQ